MLHNRRHHVAAIVAVLGAAMVGSLLALASSATAAAPGKVGFPVRKWSVSKIEQGVGKVVLGQSTVRSDDLDKVFDLGVAAFDLGPLAGRS